jgi:lysozyme
MTGLGNSPMSPSSWIRTAATPLIGTKVATDTRVKAVIHKASQGLSEDPQFVTRAGEAKARGFLWGAYHLGKPGDPIRQATFFLSLATKTGATFLAIDIEDDNPAKFMSITDAAKFIEYVHTQTGKYPAIYVNWSVRHLRELERI